MQAVLDPLGRPLATHVGSGEGADDPLYLPCMERVQASLDRRGLFYGGDAKMAARQRRATSAVAGDDYCARSPACTRSRESGRRLWSPSGRVNSP